MAEIEAKIVAQGDKIRELKSAKAAKDVIQPEVIYWLLKFQPHWLPISCKCEQVATLLALKAEYKAATGEEWKPPAAPPKAAPAKAASPPKKVTNVLQRSVKCAFITVDKNFYSRFKY